MLVAIIFMLAILILSMAVAIPRCGMTFVGIAKLRPCSAASNISAQSSFITASLAHIRRTSTHWSKPTTCVSFARNTSTPRLARRVEARPVWPEQAPQAMGFFGQPLAASSLAGTGPGGGNGMPGTVGAGGAGSASPTSGGLFNSTPTSGSSTDAGATSPPTTGTPAEPLAAQTPMEILQLAPALLALLRQAVSAPELPRRRAQAAQARREPGPTARLLAAEASSASRRRSRNSPSWSTKRRTTTTNGSFSTVR